MNPVIGVDPGFGGAIAFYWPTSGVVEVVDMPVRKDKDRPVLDLPTLLHEMRAPQHRPGTVWLERVAPRPGEGTVSSFRFGQGYGSVEMAAVANGHALRHVTPASWKRHYDLIGTDKKASLAKARELLPDLADQLKRVKDHGRAEACLIALYGHQMQMADAA